MSVVKVDNDRIYDEQGMPNLGGVNDPRMGTMDKEMKCYTCKGSKYTQTHSKYLMFLTLCM
jgi:DNA-directed RNA polymerase II subunit RPB1